MLSPFDNVAIQMFRYAGIKPTVKQVTMIADDLREIADEFEDQTRPDEEMAVHAVSALRHRIGGYANLRDYVRCLLVRGE